MAMMRSTGVLAMGTGDRSAATEPVEDGTGRSRRLRPGALPDGDRGGRPRADGPAHRLAVQAIKSTNGSIRAGWTLALVDLQAAEGGEERWFEARRLGQTDWLERLGR